jgi:lipoate-protein ligase A
MMSKSPTWRLLIDRDLPGAVNMARDVAMLEAVAGGAGQPTLRLYGWNPPCLSLGRHQGFDAADEGFCRKHRIDIVRRPTGGRALLHHLELTYAVVAPVGQPPLPTKLQDAYREICRPLVSWCGEIGITASLTPGEVNLRLPSPRSSVPCFEAPAGGEVVVGDRKLIGSAMRAHSGVILQHGAILLDWDSILQAGSMGLENDRHLRPQITTITDELGETPDRRHLETTLVRAFSEEFGVRFEEASLSKTEIDRAQKLRAQFEATS